MTEPQQALTPRSVEPRQFTLGQVLTLACADIDAQQLFCPYGDLLDVLGFMLSDVPLSDEIPAGIARCRAAVHSQHPDLALLHPPAIHEPDVAVLAWIAAQEREHGTTLALTPIEAE